MLPFKYWIICSMLSWLLVNHNFFSFYLANLLSKSFRWSLGSQSSKFKRGWTVRNRAATTGISSCFWNSMSQIWPLTQPWVSVKMCSFIFNHFIVYILFIRLAWHYWEWVFQRCMKMVSFLTFVFNSILKVQVLNRGVEFLMPRREYFQFLLVQRPIARGGGGHSTFFFWWVCATRVSKSRVKGADFPWKMRGLGNKNLEKFESWELKYWPKLGWKCIFP